MSAGAEQSPVDERPYMPNIKSPDSEHHYTYFHGDPVELTYGRLVYLCRICDTFEDSDHFKSHDRQKNIWYYEQSLRLLANLACRVWVRRPDSEAAHENLIQRALDREREQRNAADWQKIRNGCPPHGDRL